MTDPIRKAIIELIEKRGKLPDSAAADSFNYIDSGYIDSIAVISFVVEIENRFGIEITEADMERPEFRTLGGLAGMIQNKLARRG